MTTEKARLSKVQIGSIQVDGIMLPDGTFGITVQQVSSLFGLRQADATRNIKRLLGKGSQLCQVKVLESVQNRSQKFITLEHLEKVVFELSLKGNKEAIDFSRMLVGLSLTQLWSDSFGVKFEQEERTQYLSSRQEHQKQFHTRLTPFWKADGCEGKDYMRRVIEFKEISQLPKLKSVDDYETHELSLLNIQEVKYQTLRSIGMSHEDTINKIRI